MAAISPAVHRLTLESTDRLAAALAEAISDTAAVRPEIAKLQGSRCLARSSSSASPGGALARRPEPGGIADGLYRLVENLLDEVDGWFQIRGYLPSGSSAWQRKSRAGPQTP